jgi:hypothetical protein
MVGSSNYKVSDAIVRFNSLKGVKLLSCCP